jgi:hypothetical protein
MASGLRLAVDGSATRLLATSAEIASSRPMNAGLAEDAG